MDGVASVGGSKTKAATANARMMRSVSGIATSRDETSPASTARHTSVPPAITQVNEANTVGGTLKVELYRNPGETLGIGIAGE